MKYAVLSCSDGDFNVDGEFVDDFSGARVSFWDRCKALESDDTVEKAKVVLVDENFEVVNGEKEEIRHDVVPNVQVVQEEQPEEN